MRVTVLEALLGAQINFRTLERQGLGAHPIFMMACEQLANAIKALEDGKGPDDVIREVDINA